MLPKRHMWNVSWTVDQCINLFNFQIICHFTENFMQDNHIVQGPMCIIFTNAINLAQKLQGMLWKIPAIATGPLQAVKKFPGCRKISSATFKFSSEKVYVKSIVIMRYKNNISLAKGCKLFNDLTKGRSVGHHFIRDVMNSSHVCRDGHLRIN